MTVNVTIMEPFAAVSVTRASEDTSASTSVRLIQSSEIFISWSIDSIIHFFASENKEYHVQV